MGTDIHLFVERREGDKWVAVAGPNPWYTEGSGEPKEILGDWLWYGRDYDVFAILANVRNGYGFAGCDTGDGFIPIDMPRGLPEDVSPEVRAEAEAWGLDGHSHSWITLRELLEYDWSRKTKHRGVVDESGFKEFLEKGKPRSWCGGISGKNVVFVTNDEMKMIVEGRMAREENKKYVTKVEWEETYRETVGYFLDEVIPKLKNLGEPDDVRIVFWFDN